VKISRADVFQNKNYLIGGNADGMGISATLPNNMQRRVRAIESMRASASAAARTLRAG
jgi:hypothetical protein